jgi:hypothetical protein
VAVALGVAGGIASLLVVPYLLAVNPGPVATRGLPLPVALALACLQNTVLLFLLAWAGLHLGAPLGLDASVVRAWMARRTPPVRGHWAVAATLGAIAGGAILLLDAVVFHQAVADALARSGHGLPQVARWKGALACFYGGIVEEVELRLFLMSAIAWLLAKLTRGSRGTLVVVANVVAALAFGAGHLPLAAHVFGLTTAIVVRTIVLNALGGFVFGALYGRWSLERAMVAHFCADVVLHVAAGG